MEANSLGMSFTPNGTYGSYRNSTLLTHSHTVEMIRSDAEASGYGLVPNGAGFTGRPMVWTNTALTSTSFTGTGSWHTLIQPSIGIYIWRRIL